MRSGRARNGRNGLMRSEASARSGLVRRPRTSKPLSRRPKGCRWRVYRPAVCAAGPGERHGKAARRRGAAATALGASRGSGGRVRPPRQHGRDRASMRGRRRGNGGDSKGRTFWRCGGATWQRDFPAGQRARAGRPAGRGPDGRVGPQDLEFPICSSFAPPSSIEGFS